MKRPSPLKELVILFIASATIMFLSGWLFDYGFYIKDVVLAGRPDWYMVQVTEGWTVAVGLGILSFMALENWLRRMGGLRFKVVVR